MTNYSSSALLEAYAQGILEPPASDAHAADTGGPGSLTSTPTRRGV
ncbi:hypothetical protein [Rhodococcus erythropolis]|nr:hypothetical protein [Rhodococcus erythropolis]OFV72796.1 hypothetical protein RERY_66120 [Rhodococcus erythropolis]